MKNVKISAILAAALIVSSAAAAAPISVYADTAQTSVEQPAQTVKLAKVTSVTADTLSVTLFDMKTPDMTDKPECKQGTRPEKKDRIKDRNTDSKQTDSKKKDKPADSDKKPAADFKGMPFDENGETASISLKGVTITKDGKAAAVTDIAKDDIITVVYTNGKVTEINLDTFKGNKGGRQEKKAGKKKKADTSANTAV